MNLSIVFFMESVILLEGNLIGADGVGIICDALKQNHSIVSLNLSTVVFQ